MGRVLHDVEFCCGEPLALFLGHLIIAPNKLLLGQVTRGGDGWRYNLTSPPP